MSRPTPTPPLPGQVSVWTFPRPPRLESVARHVVVVFGGETIAETRCGRCPRGMGLRESDAVDACLVDGERVVPQPGGFYGGWITSDVSGPFKGEPGSMGW